MTRLRIILVFFLSQSIRGNAGILNSRSFSQTVPLVGDAILNYDEDVVHVQVEPVVLAPVHYVRPGNTKRDRMAALAPKSEETLYWSGQDGTIAKLKVAMPGANENIVNLEAIDDMVQKVTCPNNDTGQFKIQFAERADLNNAQDVWQWVNQADENAFMMIVGAGKCGWNGERILYNVDSLTYNNEQETAILNVRRTTWKDAAHTYDLTVGKSAAPQSTAAQRRAPRSHIRRSFLGDIGDAVEGAASSAVDTVSDAAGATVDAVGNAADAAGDAISSAADATGDFIGSAADKAGKVTSSVGNAAGKAASAAGKAAGKAADAVGDAAGKAADAVDSVVNPDVSPDFTIPFKSDFSNKSLTFSQDGVSIGATCVQCFTTGAINIQGRFRAQDFQIEEAWIEASTQGLSAKAVISMALKGELTDTLAKKELQVFKVSPAGISIPGVLTIGPTVAVSLGAEISKVKGGVTVSCGGTTTIPASTSRLDFLSQKDTTSKGWKPSFKAEPFKADASIEASASAFLKAAIGLEISAVETGFSADISAKLPSLSASLKAISSATCTACGNFQSGLQGSLNLGTSIDVSLKKKILGDEEPLWSITLAQAQTPSIGGFCKGVGLQGAACRAQ